MPAQDVFDAAGPKACRHPNTQVEASNSINCEEYLHNGHNAHNGDKVVDTSIVPDTLQETNEDGSTTAITKDNDGALSDSAKSVPGDLLDVVSAQLSFTRSRVHDESRPTSAPNLQIRMAGSHSSNMDEERDTIEDQQIESIPLDTDMRHRWRAEDAPHSAPPAINHGTRRRIHLHSLFDRDSVPGGGLRRISKLIFTAADCRVKSIIGNKNVQIGELPRIHSEHLRFQPTSPQDLLSCSVEALESQLKEIYVSLKSSQAEDTEKLSVMAYLFSLSCHARLAHVIVNSSILKLLVRMLAQESRLELSRRILLPMLCLVLGVLFRFATFIAPSSPDQLRELVMILLDIVNEHPDALGKHKHPGKHGMESRPLALACLGELLFYISTQQEWELPMEGVECVLDCVNDPDISVRYYAVRTLGNMLIHCADVLLPKLITEQIVVALTRGILRYGEPDLDTQNNSRDSWEVSQMHIALRTAKTEALAQVLRHLRTPSSVAHLPTCLRQSLLPYFAKQDILHALWCGAQNENGAIELAIASFNVINALLDIKLGADREAGFAAIKTSRDMLLDRIVTFSSIQKILLVNETSSETDGERSENLTILQAKALIMLYLGVQLNRDFLLAFVQNNALKLVEHVLCSITNGLYEDNDKPNLPSSEPKLSAFELYLAQCALNLCKLAIRMALKLGADCFSSQENIDIGHTDNNNNNNAEHRFRRISPIPFELFSELLRNPTCRVQLLNYFVVNDSKQYTFFLRLMAKLLTAFPNETLSGYGDSEKTTIASYVSAILVELFQYSAREANEIVLVEKLVLFTNLLPAVIEHIYPTEVRIDSKGGTTSGVVAVNCFKILHAVLLDFDYEHDNGDYELYDRFIRSTLIPYINSILKEDGLKVESTWSLASELLFGLISSDSSLIREAKDLHVISAIFGLLSVPSKFQALPSHATQLLNVLIDTYGAKMDVLYESGIARSIKAALIFAAAHKEYDSNTVDLLAVLLDLLHQHFENLRQNSSVPAPPDFNELVSCGPLMPKFCAGVHANINLHIRLQGESPEDDDNEIALSRRGRNQIADKIANLASRCLVLLTQVSMHTLRS
ncbi:unnamed protein product [Phytophthora fragariaefolia]|uniref:Unnamed protein product n=1 Tax=Phytophthora fragariaefolia TaxID=1490495 RepID=A0A9W6TWH1_9STRA|nr:unnamed protein product [Phytophthora fragariaefolia]